MNPSPYLLRFSGLASQKWTCPSTTKYFSPSFSYKALSSFSRTHDTLAQSPGRIALSCVPHSQAIPVLRMTGTAQPHPIKGLVTPWSYLLPRHSEADHTGCRPFVALMISDLGSRGKAGPSPQYGLSIQMGSGVISS